MTVGSAQKTAQKAPERPPFQGALTARAVDRRSRAWRRRQELLHIFIEAMGGKAATTPVQRLKAETAAELAVSAELTRAAFMAGRDGVTADDVVRTAALAARAERALDIKSHKPAGPSLADYLASKGKAA